MKRTRNQSTKKTGNLWKNLTSDILDKVNRKRNNISDSQIDRDMGDTHTPISRLDLTGMNKEQAKEAIDKIIGARLEMISHLELTELKIDYKERERQRARAAERINERRNRRKKGRLSAAETIVTEQGIYSDYKHASVFDMLQPESFPYDEEKELEPIAGQVSIMEVLAAAEKPLHKADQAAGFHTNTTLDEAVDKVFAFYGKHKTRLVQQLTRWNQKIEPKLELKKKAAAVILMLLTKEKIFADKMYFFIDWVDRKNEAFSNWIAFIQKKTVYLINSTTEYAELHKKKILVRFSIGIAAIALITLTLGSMTAYEYSYNGKVLGVVKNQEDVYKTIDIIGDKLSYEYDAEITIDKEKDIRFNKIIAFHQDIDDKEDILNRLTYMRNMKVNGHGIYVDGNIVAILESEKRAREILAEIKETYVKKDAGIQYKKVDFAENVTIKDIETKLGNIKKKDKALEYMMTGAVEKKIHLVQSGETFSEIAKMYGIKQSELKLSNPDVIPEKLHIDQEICLNQIVPLVTVQTVEVAEYKETIPYEITYENTGSLYKNEQTVKSRGANGEKDVVAEIVRNNGIEVSRTEINSTVLNQPVAQVVLVGTKEPPPLIGTGSFIYPIRGTLTSRYGTRWGRLHSGIDLAAPTGTKIKAADGGKVVFSGYNGSLGYTVKIDHGGGRVTLYGHCSKLLVKSGDRVYQGQHIANVGNTGRSTGPHVHFEVQINGKTKNPLNYL